jgi:OOP family OmpA-OmpF porin
MVRWQISAVLGVMATIAITGAALLSETKTIEADIATRSASSLASEVTSWATVSVSGRDVTVSGAAPNEDLRQLALERVDRLFGVRAVDDSLAALLPEQSPYTVALDRAGPQLTISGFAPSQPERGRMVASLVAAVPDLAYNDTLQLARGIPDTGFLTALSQLYPLLTHLESGRIDLTDRAVTIKGVAASNDAYDTLTRLALALPSGYTVGVIDIVRPLASPFTWSAVREESGILLSGFAPDPETRNRLFGAARASAGSLTVRDDVDLASGETDGFADAAFGALDFLDLMDEGRIDLRDGTLSITGRATTPEAYRTLTSHLAGFKPAGFAVTTSIDLPVVIPYTLSASRSGDKVTVTGFAPTSETNDTIKAAAQRVAGPAEAVIETTIASGAPDGFEAAARFAIGLLEYVSKGTVLITDRSILVSGAAITGSDLIELEGAVASAKPQGFEVTMAVTPPIVKPYVWYMEKSEDSLVLGGFVPSEDARTNIRKEAESVAGDLAVADKTSLASGLPGTVQLGAVAAFAGDRLERMTSGRVTLSDDVLSVTGTADTARNGMEVVAAMDGPLPAGVTKGIVQVEFPSAFRFEIERGYEALTVQGTVPDAAAKATLLGAVNRMFGKADAVIDLEVTEGLPEGASAAAALALRAASQLAIGTVTVDGTVITAKGEAFTSEGSARFASDLIPSVPKGFRLDSAIGVVPPGYPVTPAVCDAMISAVLTRSPVSFDGGADIAKESHGTLDWVAMIVSRCVDAKIHIAAYTDETGDSVANAALSSARAQSVRNYLAGAGVNPARLDTRTRPAASPVPENAPENGKPAQRVEIHAETGASTP